MWCHEAGTNRRGYDSKNDYSKNQPLGEENFSMLFTGLSGSGSCGGRCGTGGGADGFSNFGGKRWIIAACGSFSHSVTVVKRTCFFMVNGYYLRLLSTDFF